MILLFDDFELDLDCYELRRDGAAIATEPQVFDVLTYLIRHQGELVTKNDLLDSVWGDRFVSESTLTSRIKTVRQLLGDDARKPRYIRTIHGRGYRFEVEVSEKASSESAKPADGSLPADRTALVGRNESIAEIAELVKANRYVSLLGIGGAGKTRMALAVGRSMPDDLPDGVWFIDLIPTHDRASIETAFAHNIGLAATDDLSKSIDQREALFILDNCEHVLEEVASLLDDLLATTTKPRFLTTSREPLGLIDERRVVVDPLDDVSAVELLASSAARVGVELEQGPLADQVCARLDGLPLAIELAGAQLRHLSLAELAARLDRRFELLSADGRQADGRHGSLAGILDETWDMLDQAESDLLAQLAVMAGTFTVTDVEALTEDGMDLRRLARLIDRSLVSRTREGRLRIFETVRLFATERSDIDATRQRHAEWCTRSVGHSIDDHFADFSRALWYLEHYDNISAAERHLAQQGDIDGAARLVAASGLAMHTDLGARAAATHRRVAHYVDRVTEADLLCRLHLAGVMCAMATRSPRLIRSHGEAAVTAAESEPGLLPMALVLRSWSAVFDSSQEAIELVSRAHDLATDGGEHESARIASSYRGFHLAMARQYDEAAATAQAVIDSADPTSAFRYGTYSSIAVLAAIEALEPGDLAQTWAKSLLEIPSVERAMWSNQLIAAALFAATNDDEEATRLIQLVHHRLDRAGVPALPDLLLPIAVMALRQGAEDRVRDWLRAVRDAGRPTQSFQMTILYDRLRQTVGMADEPVLDTISLDEIGSQALQWMNDQHQA